VNISCIPSRRLRAADSYSRSKKRGNCSSRFSPSSAFHLPSCPQEIASLALLLFRQFIENITNFVIAAALHGLLASEQFFNPSPQGFGPIDDEQVLAVGGRMCFFPSRSTPTAAMT
jgi:hypothetical protein